MKSKLLLMTIALILCLPSGSRAGIILDEEVTAKITEIMQQPVKVYDLDYAKGDEILKRMDDWASGQLNISGAEIIEYEEGRHTGLHIKTAENIPIAVSGEKTEGVKSKRPFDVFYIKERFSRRFIKDLTVPTTQKLTPEEVKRLGEDFIEGHKFYSKTELDKMGAFDVISRMRRRINIKGDLGEALAICQTAVFKRSFNGLEVFNSKQNVSIHPDSREIISYKSLNWIPVDERSGKEVPYDSSETILERIQVVFSKSPYTIKVSDVHLGMYVVNDKIAPAIRLKGKAQLEKGKSEPIRKTLIVGLIKGLEIEESKMPIKRPEDPKVK